MVTQRLPLVIAALALVGLAFGVGYVTYPLLNPQLEPITVEPMVQASSVEPTAAPGSTQEAVTDSAVSGNPDMQLFWDTWNLLGMKYVDPHTLDTQDMVYGAIHGMVQALEDPYTTFMTPKENKEFQDSLDGMLAGIGAELTLRHGMLTVISPLKNTPAKRAGLQPEDIIYMVDGELTEEMTLE